MEQSSKWKIIHARKFRWQLRLDIDHCSPLTLRAIILDRRTPAALLDEIAQAHCYDEDLMRDLVRCPHLDEVTLAFIALTASDDMKAFISKTRVVEVVTGDGPDAAVDGDGKKLNITQLIQRMSIPQKIKLAVKGAKEARGMLIRESSKLICMAVLENPRLTIGEVEFFAKSTNLSEDIMRKIGMNTEWTRKNTIVSALVNNPKTPIGISM
ncbi:MAG TPA: hypothetical protein VK654_11030, partial [Nitrospirota bacterium]|nr:hypothetical protein [Nitrospirota bacterium]